MHQLCLPFRWPYRYHLRVVQIQLSCWELLTPCLMNDQWSHFQWGLPKPVSLTFKCLIVTCECKSHLGRGTMSDANDFFEDHTLEIWQFAIIIFLQMSCLRPGRFFVELAGLSTKRMGGDGREDAVVERVDKQTEWSWCQLPASLRKQAWYEWPTELLEWEQHWSSTNVIADMWQWQQRQRPLLLLQASSWEEEGACVAS